MVGEARTHVAYLVTTASNITVDRPDKCVALFTGSDGSSFVQMTSPRLSNNVTTDVTTMPKIAQF
jgi:hypothetical protein